MDDFYDKIKIDEFNTVIDTFCYNDKELSYSDYPFSDVNFLLKYLKDNKIYEEKLTARADVYERYYYINDICIVRHISDKDYIEIYKLYRGTFPLFINNFEDSILKNRIRLYKISCLLK